MKKRILCLLVLALMVFNLSACGKSAGSNAQATPSPTADASTPAPTEEKKEAKLVEIKIPTFKIGENVGAKFFLPQVERFNKKYEGKYKITLEEVPQDSYNDKIKQLALQNKLPAFIESVDREWFEKAIVEQKKYYDLSKWLDEHPDIKNVLDPGMLKFNTKESSAVVSMPVAIIKPIGLYYNSDLYKPAKRVGEMTLDEFEQSLGNNKIAFMTGENAWTTSLMFTAFVASEPGGPEMLNAGVINKVYDYTSPMWVNSVIKLQKYLQKYASSNTVGAVYADAANSFMSKKSAIIPNGPWMVGDFAQDSKDKWSNGFDGTQVKGEMYPNNIAIFNSTGYGQWIPAGLSDEETQCALAFLEFIYSPEELEACMLAEGGTVPALKTSEGFLAKQKENPTLNDLNTAVNPKTIIVPRACDVMPQSVSDVEFGKLLPKLIDGSMTPEQFCKQLTELAQATKS